MISFFFQTSFFNCLSTRRFSGGLRFLHDLQRLEIQVDPEGREDGGGGGGDR